MDHPCDQLFACAGFSLNEHRGIRVRHLFHVPQNLLNRLKIDIPSVRQRVERLSGGQRQAVAIARATAFDAKVIIMDEPTRGIDVGAKAEIEKLIIGLSEEGLAILFISSELEEVISCCDRIAVLRDRQVLTELSGTEMEEASIMRVIADKDVAQ